MQPLVTLFYEPILEEEMLMQETTGLPDLLDFAVFCMLHVFFWVIPRRLNFIYRRFGTLSLFHLYKQVGVEFYTYL